MKAALASGSLPQKARDMVWAQPGPAQTSPAVPFPVWPAAHLPACLLPQDQPRQVMDRGGWKKVWSILNKLFFLFLPPFLPLSRSLFCTVLLAGIFYVVPLCRDNPLRRCSTLFPTRCKASLTATPHQCSEPWRERGGGICDRCRGVKRNAKDEVHSRFISNPAHFTDIFTWSYGMGGVWTRYGSAPLCVVHVSSASTGGGTAEQLW